MTGDDLVDYGTVPDIYSDGIGAIENLGDCFRQVFFTYARPEYPGGPMQRIVVARLVRPQKSLMMPRGAIRQLLDHQSFLPTSGKRFDG